MVDLDALAPNYRRAKERWSDAQTLTQGYNALKICVEGSSHGLVDHVKSVIECVCVTTLAEFNKSLSTSTPGITELLVGALGCVGLHNSKGAGKLSKLLSGFNRLSDAISEIRNETGPVSHGRDGFFDDVGADLARTYLHVGDLILSVLLNAMEGTEPNLVMTREPYERFNHLNDRIDSAVSVRARVDPDADSSVIVITISPRTSAEAIEVRVEPSRLLYGVDRAIYVEILNGINIAQNGELALMEEEELARGPSPGSTP